MVDPVSLIVEVPEPFADDIRSAVAAGEYASAGEAVVEALKQWSVSRLHPAQPDQLRQAWKAGKESGRAKSTDLRELRDIARRRLASTRAPVDSAG